MKPENNQNQSNTPQNHKQALRTFFGGKGFMALFSLLLSCCAWFFVVTFVDPNKEAVLSVPVDFAYNNAAYTKEGIDIVEKPNKSVDVRVQADGNVLKEISAADILVSPDYTTVKGAGEYTLPLKIAIRTTNKTFQLLTKTTDQTISVRFDKVIARKYPVNVEASGIVPEAGYYMDQPVPSSAEVTLTGPESEMIRIAKVVAKVDLNETRTESTIVNSKLIYLDEEGAVVATVYVTSDVDQVEITIPILKIKELPLVLEYSGVPAGYDPAQLRPKLSETTIRVSGSSTQLEGIESISVGYVDLTKFQLGEPVLCNVNLPDGLRNIDNLQQVTATFNTSGYSVRTVTVTQFRTVNAPTGTTITYPVERINSVTLIGRQDELDALEEDGVVAQIDASPANLTVRQGQQKIAVKIIIPSTQTVFATGSYMALCNIETMDGATAEATAAQTNGQS